MNPWLTRLFGLEKFAPGDAGVRFEFAREMPAWAWVLACAGLVFVAAWSYSRLSGARAGRIALATARSLTLLVLLTLALGPQLVRQPERVERDCVVVLVDRSGSLRVADVERPGGARGDREEQLRSSLAAAMPAFEALAKDRTVLWLGFDSGAYPLRTDAAGAPALDEPTGRRTLLGEAVDEALRRVAARPVSGMVIVSDGRSSDTLSKPTLRRLEAEQIPVFTVALGSAKPLPDFDVTAEAPSAAFVNDVVPVNVQIGVAGEDAGGAVNATIELVDDATGLVLDSRRVDQPDRAPGARANVTLTSTPDKAGRSGWTVRIRPDTADLSTRNNSASFAIELADRPIRIVYFDGYPRWEQRYLKTLLLREKSIRSASMLLASDRQYMQEGSEPLRSIPTSPGDWTGIDVVVLGDVRAELFSRDQLAQLREQVATRGAGLLIIGGQGSMPSGYFGGEVADLLPFVLDRSGESAIPVWADDVTVEPTQTAARYGLMRLSTDALASWPSELSDPQSGWSSLRWAQRIDPARLKPTAEVLALARPEASGAGEPSALVISMRYGAGRVVYVATDEIWRWRYGRGEVLYERFWLPIMRFLARDSIARTGKSVLLEASPQRAIVDQPIRVSARIADEAALAGRDAAAGIDVRITSRRSTGSESPQGARLKLSNDGRASFSATWLPAEPGTYSIELDDALLASGSAAVEVDVATRDDEMRFPHADHGALAALAAVSGGASLEPDKLAEVVPLLPNRQIRILGTPEIETLWDRPVVLALFVFLLAWEWFGRRWLQLS